MVIDSHAVSLRLSGRLAQGKKLLWARRPGREQVRQCWRLPGDKTTAWPRQKRAFGARFVLFFRDSMLQYGTKYRYGPRAANTRTTTNTYYRHVDPFRSCQ